MNKCLSVTLHGRLISCFELDPCRYFVASPLTPSNAASILISISFTSFHSLHLLSRHFYPHSLSFSISISTPFSDLHPFIAISILSYFSAPLSLNLLQHHRHPFFYLRLRFHSFPQYLHLLSYLHPHSLYRLLSLISPFIQRSLSSP